MMQEGMIGPGIIFTHSQKCRQEQIKEIRSLYHEQTVEEHNGNNDTEDHVEAKVLTLQGSEDALLVYLQLLLSPRVE